MKGLTEPKDARERALAAFDPHVYDSVYADLKRAFGFTDETTRMRSNGYGDMIPRYPDLMDKTMTNGRAPRLLTASNIAVSRVASKMPLFKFPQLDQLDSMIRSEVLRISYHGEQHCFSPWHNAVASAFDDADSIGYGTLEVWPIINPNSGMPQVHVQHISSVDHAWDPHKRDPHESRYHVIQKWVSVDEAAERIGWKKAKGCAVKVFETAASQYTWSCRQLTYYDFGYGKNGKPGVLEFWGNIWHEPEAVYENPIGRPPLVLGVNYVKPKMRRPLGRIRMQAQDYETLFQLEQALLNSALNGHGAVMVDMEAVDEQDWADFQAGLTRFIRFNSNLERKPMELIPTDQLQAALLPAIQWYASLYSQDSMVSDLQRGDNGGDRKTATQNLIEDRNQTANMGWTLMMMLKLQLELGAVLVDAMRLMDRHPRVLDIMQANVPVNVPNVASSSLYAMLSEPSRIEINPDSLTGDDDKIDKAQRQAWLWQTFQSGLVGQVFDPMWWAEEWVKAGGRDDPRLAIMQQAMPLGPNGGVMPALPMLGQGQQAALPAR